MDNMKEQAAWEKVTSREAAVAEKTAYRTLIFTEEQINNMKAEGYTDNEIEQIATARAEAVAEYEAEKQAQTEKDYKDFERLIES